MLPHQVAIPTRTRAGGAATDRDEGGDMTPRDPVAELLDAEFHESEARLDILEAEAHARKARDEVREIAALQTTKAKAGRMILELRERTTDSVDAIRREVESLLRELERGIERVSNRFAAWDAARERRFSASLDAAEAKLARWRTQERQRTGMNGLPAHDLITTLTEGIATGRARLADWQHERHDRHAQEALEDAARDFDAAYDAAASRYDN
jgi:hypothetical protein